MIDIRILCYTDQYLSKRHAACREPRNRRCETPLWLICKWQVIDAAGLKASLGLSLSHPRGVHAFPVLYSAWRPILAFWQSSPFRRPVLLEAQLDCDLENVALPLHSGAQPVLPGLHDWLADVARSEELQR